MHFWRPLLAASSARRWRWETVCVSVFLSVVCLAQVGCSLEASSSVAEGPPPLAPLRLWATGGAQEGLNLKGGPIWSAELGLAGSPHSGCAGQKAEGRDAEPGCGAGWAPPRCCPGAPSLAGPPHLSPLCRLPVGSIGCDECLCCCPLPASRSAERLPPTHADRCVDSTSKAGGGGRFGEGFHRTGPSLLSSHFFLYIVSFYKTLRFLPRVQRPPKNLNACPVWTSPAGESPPPHPPLPCRQLGAQGPVNLLVLTLDPGFHQSLLSWQACGL